MEDPKQCKGIVKREVIRVVTPGTAIDSPLLQETTSSYLVALSRQQNVWGLAFVMFQPVSFGSVN